MVLPQPREIILMHGWRAIIASQGVHLSISKPAELSRCDGVSITQQPNLRNGRQFFHFLLQRKEKGQAKRHTLPTFWLALPVLSKGAPSGINRWIRRKT